MNPKTLEDSIVHEIAAPRIGTAYADIRDYGAVPGSGTAQTQCIQDAIDAVHSKGGGRVCIPHGRFLTGSLTLLTGVELHLASKESIVCFSTKTNERDYPLTYSRWEATACYNYRALIYARGQTDIAITGNGILDGLASPTVWWNWTYQKEQAWSKDCTDRQHQARMKLREMNRAGVPVPDRRFGDGFYLRPNFVQWIDCERCELAGFTIQNSPMWILNPVRCKSVTVRGLHVCSHGPNNDGCDPESCNGVLIEGNRFNTGDDCISLKSGRDREGREEGLACRNIVIRGNHFADGHGGIALGSEASGGICNVVARGNVFESKNLTYALRLKTNARRGGVMENIVFCDSEIPCVSGAAVHATMLYEDGRNGDWLPEFRKIRIENLRARGGRFGIYIEAFPEVPVTGLVLKNIEIEGVQNSLYAANWKSPEMVSVRINGREYPRPIMVRIEGVPREGAVLNAVAEATGEALHYTWRIGTPGGETEIGTGERITLQHVSAGEFIYLHADDANGRGLKSIPYRVLSYAPNGSALAGASDGYAAARLRSRGILSDAPYEEAEGITRRRLCRLLLPLLNGEDYGGALSDVDDDDPDIHAIRRALGAGAIALDDDGCMQPQSGITRQDMATVAMQCCGALLCNASTTMPICADAQSISAAKGTNVARCLYYGLMSLDLNDRFRPNDRVTMGEAVTILSCAADRAGM